ncbi:MAG: prephenate dehydratase [Neisseriaceae bacterium]|nr:MAG: prephenate dehydratase [Neisseriaceae bacterium]
MSEKIQKELQLYREKIDHIDLRLLELINERASMAQKIGEIKGTAAVYNPEREAKVLNRLREKNIGPLSDESVIRLFREIMSECLALEKPLSVAYLGPQGTFTQQATIRQFGHAAKTIACQSIDEAFHLVEIRQADYLVVPIENSTEGGVGRTLDLLVSTPLLVHGEVTLRIHHQLLSKANQLKDVKKILAHPQALAQCHEWLNKNLNLVPKIPVSSNAEGAKIAQDDPSIASIGSIIAAEIYQLNVLGFNIENEANNSTRFLALGHQTTQSTGNDKTSLIISAPNQPGAVHYLLEPFSQHKISMSKLESRPSRGGLWEYIFFIDIEGHIQDKNVQLALDELKKRASFVKWIGSYPVSPL